MTPFPKPLLTSFLHLYYVKTKHLAKSKYLSTRQDSSHRIVPLATPDEHRLVAYSLNLPDSHNGSGYTTFHLRFHKYRQYQSEPDGKALRYGALASMSLLNIRGQAERSIPARVPARVIETFLGKIRFAESTFVALRDVSHYHKQVISLVAVKAASEPDAQLYVDSSPGLLCGVAAVFPQVPRVIHNCGGPGLLRLRQR